MELQSSAPGQEAREPVPALVDVVDHRRASDRNQVLALLKEYWASVGLGDEDAETRYRWLYLDNPHGTALTVIARDQATGTPAGLTSLFPRRVLVTGRERVGAIGGDGYVRPAFRRRGIATQLHRAALVAMPGTGIDFMYGPPEPNNLRALLHAGAEIVGDVERYSRPVGAGGFGRRLRRDSLAARLLAPLIRPSRTSLRVLPLGEKPEPGLDRVLADTASAAVARNLVMPLYDAAYYRWRFFRSPQQVQRPMLLLDGDRPVGVAAVEQAGGRAALIGVLCPEDRLRLLLRGLLDACRSGDSVQLQIHTPAPALQLTLLSLGFISRGKKPFQVHTAADHPDRAALLRPAAWRYQWGDGDGDHVF